MKVKRWFFIFLIGLVFAVLLSACGSKDPLVGTWQEPVSGITLVFDKNNNVTISLNERSYTMTYSEQNPDLLVIKMSTDGSTPDMTLKYKVIKDQLTVTDNNTDTIFYRVKQ